MNYLPAYIYTGEGKLHPVILHATPCALIILNCRTREQVSAISLPFKIEIDRNTEYLFRIKYDRVYILFSPFRADIIAALNLDEPQSLCFTAVDHVVEVTVVGIKFSNRYYDFAELSYDGSACSVANTRLELVDDFCHELLYWICVFLRDNESVEESDSHDELEAVEECCETSKLDIEASLGHSVEQLSFIERPAQSPQEPLLSSQILEIISGLPADEEADVFAVAEALEGFPEDVQQILQAAILNDPSRLAILAAYDQAAITAYIRALVGEQTFTDQEEEIDDAMGGLRAVILNRQESESEEIKDNSELSFECITSFTNEKPTFNPFSNNAKTSYHSAEDNGCNTSSLTGRSAVSSSTIKSKNTSVFSEQFKSYAMNDYYNSVEDAIKYMQQERVCHWWMKKRLNQYKIALNCTFDLNSESVCEIFYSSKVKKPLLFNPQSTSFEVEKCILPKDIEDTEMIEKYCEKKKIADWAGRSLVFANSHMQAFMFMFDSEDERNRIQIAVTMICDALVLPVVQEE